MAKIYGVDVSHWEGTINWQVAKDTVNFCLIKATDGWNNFVDPEFSNNRTGCEQYSIPWGAYHFYQPAVDPIEQAEHLINIVGTDAPVYVVDVETNYGALPTWEDLLKDFLNRVETLTGKKCMIYTSPGFWNANAIPVPAWTDDYDLWVAHWGTSNPILPNGWSSYIVHQFSDSGHVNGISGAVDEDWFNGGMQEMLDYFGNSGTPPPPTGFLVEITASYLNMRATPYGTIVGKLRKGNILLVTKTKKDGSGRDWYYSGDYGCFASWWTKPYS